MIINFNGESQNKGENVPQVMTVVNGFCFGSGLILAALVFKLLFKIGFCG